MTYDNSRAFAGYDAWLERNPLDVEAPDALAAFHEERALAAHVVAAQFHLRCWGCVGDHSVGANSRAEVIRAAAQIGFRVLEVRIWGEQVLCADCQVRLRDLLVTPPPLPPEWDV